MNRIRLTLFCLAAALLPSLGAAELKLNKGDRIAYIGNALADRMQHEGYLEALLQARYPDHELVFRNLGFSGDTITKRAREPEFGSPEDWLKRVKANVVFAFFGYGEALRGPAEVDGFKKEVAGLIDQTQGADYGHGPVRMVLFSPIAHEDLGSRYLPDGSANNANLALYTAAMKAVAAEKGVPFVDLFAPTKKLYADSNQPLTVNGIHLNGFGSQQVAIAAEQALYGNAQDRKVDMEKLRAAVLEKNLHWWSYYRTVDGYNVYGGRSRLAWHGQSNADVMAVEMKTFAIKANNRDEAVWAAARGSAHEVRDDNLPPQLVVESNRKGPNADGSFPYLGGAEAIGKMKIHEGMKVNLFASEERFPDLINPVQVAVDTDSRLWAATWQSYPHWNPNEPMGDKLVILPDEDGDGVADRMITFADKLNSVTSFEFWGGGVLVAALPELLFLKDTDGDDVADVRIVMLNGLSSSDTHHSANAMVVGPDGGVYWSRGIFNVCNMETPTKTFTTGSSGVYRFDPRTFEIDFHFPIGPNPHGDVFDAWGYQFASDGTSGTGSYVAIGKGQGSYRQWYQKRVRPVPAIGMLSGSHFPPEHDGNFLICNAIGFLGIAQHEVKYNGAEITAEEVEPILFSSDPNFRPSDCEMGGDGALYVSDWCNALIGHMQHNMRDPNRDHKHGRIYRVTYEGRPLQKPVKMRGRPIAEVLENFRNPDQAVRYRTRLELSGRDPKQATAAAAEFAKQLDMEQANEAMAALNCLWVHSEARIPNLDLAAKVMTAKDPRVRAAAVRTLGWWAKSAPSGLAMIQDGARDSEPLVRAEAVVAAANFEPSAGVAEVIFEAGTRPLDPHMEYVLKYASGVLNVNAIAAQSLKAGEKLSQAAERYLLRSADNATLLKMERSPAVFVELLTRPGIDPENRRLALYAVAAARKVKPADLLAELIGNREGENLDGYAEILPALKQADLQGASQWLSGLADASPHASLRAAAIAALINGGGDAGNLFDAALEDRKKLGNFLDAVPLISESAVLDELYPRIRPLAFGLPRHLQTRAAAPSAGPGVSFDYYEQSSIPNVDLRTLDKWKPTRSGKVKELTHNIPNRRPDGFAIKLTTWVNIPASGRWEFGISSDDGSRLYLDGRLLIDNDGLHGMVEKLGAIELTEGPHRLVTSYYDNGGGDGYAVTWQGPGVKKGAIPASALGGSGGGLEHAAAVALGYLTGGDVIFGDMLALLAQGKHRDLALAHLSAAESIPQGQLAALGKALATGIPETPIGARDGKPFQDSLALAKRVAGQLPAAEAKALTAAVGDLDLVVVRISPIPETLRFDRTEFTVRAGKPVKVIFASEDAIPHNLVIVQPGSYDEVGELADKMVSDPKGFEKQWVPESDKIIHATKLVNKGETEVLSFTAPEKPGDYPFVCLFPGHRLLARGIMRVE